MFPQLKKATISSYPHKNLSPITAIKKNSSIVLTITKSPLLFPRIHIKIWFHYSSHWIMFTVNFTWITCNKIENYKNESRMFKNLEPTEENNYVKYKSKCKRFKRNGRLWKSPGILSGLISWTLMLARRPRISFN